MAGNETDKLVNKHDGFAMIATAVSREINERQLRLDRKKKRQERSLVCAITLPFRNSSTIHVWSDLVDDTRSFDRSTTETSEKNIATSIYVARLPRKSKRIVILYGPMRFF